MRIVIPTPQKTEVRMKQYQGWKVVHKLEITEKYLIATLSCHKERSSHSELFLDFIGTETEHGLSINPSKNKF